MSTAPFQEIPFDGVMSLGFKDLYTSGGFILSITWRRGIDTRRGQPALLLLADGEDCEVTCSAALIADKVVTVTLDVH